jgi:hypothetical protein
MAEPGEGLAGVSDLVVMLFFGYFSCLIVAFTAVAMWLIGSFNNSTLSKQRHPRPPIEQTVTPQEIAPLHLEPTKKETSAAADDAAGCSPVSATTTKGPRGYGNALGYAQEIQYGPKRLFSNW